MKKITLLSLALGITIATFGQNTKVTLSSNLPHVPAAIAKLAVPVKSKMLSGYGKGISRSQHNNGERAANYDFSVVQIGDTYYDLQTNGSICNRLVHNSDGSFSAMWTYAPIGDDETNGWPNRGSGYNYYNGSTWGSLPTSRIETGRTGWPNIVDPSNGSEVFVSHNTDVGQLQLTSRPTKGTGSWTQSTTTLTSPSPFGNWWPRMVSSGDTIHEISITYPALVPGSGNDTEYHGQNGALLYSRSLDGGATWDKVNDTLQGLDSASYNGFGGDEYAIDVKGDTVAIVAGGFDNDVVLLKSTDNGNTWKKTIVFHFAISHYVFGAKTDTGNGQADTLQTNDGSLAVLLDNSGSAHVWYGYMQILCFNADSNYYFPGSNALIYWNENTDTLKAIASAYNSLGNIVGGSTWGMFNQGFCSWPSAGIDDSGHIFVSFSAIDGAYVDPNDNFIRHVYLIASKDGGHTWGVGNNKLGSDMQLDDTTYEGIFASVARKVDNNVSLIYQKDSYAGVSTTTSNNIPVDPGNVGEDNFIMFIQQPTSFLLYPTGIPTIAKSNMGISLYPNPNGGNLNVSFTKSISQTSIFITNILGSTVKEFNNIDIVGNQITLNLADLVSGVYFVRIETAQGSETQKIVIAKN